jgi:hypothetical protein
LIAFFFLGGLKAQNLVNNYSLETYSTCPTSSSQITYATGWNSCMNSPEYLNFCSSSIYADVPTNYFGFQNAGTGNAYGGALFYGSFAGSYLANLREHLYVTLSSPLVVGTTYYVNFKVNLVDNSEYAVNNIGIQFVTSWNGSFGQNNTAHVYTTSVVSDKTNWTTISGTFVPSVAYNALMVGNFFLDANCTVNFVGSSTDIGYNAYYFVDDVYVSTTPVALPVSWTNTSVDVNGKVARLQWQFDGDEISSYLIEKSETGKTFTPVQTVTAEPGKTLYTATDVIRNFDPVTLYRIRAITANGETHLSPVLEARLYDAETDFLNAYPSPVKKGENLALEWSSREDGDKFAQIISLEGQVIKEITFPDSENGVFATEIATDDLVRGTYWIKAGSLTRMFLVE